MKSIDTLRSEHRVFPLLAALVSILTAASAYGQGVQPRGWDAGAKPTLAVDINPDPHIVEIDLEARVATIEIAPGLQVPAWTYNGSVPGPLIRARAGNRLIVHFRNGLPQPSTVHWHGVRVPIEMDGVPGISQPEVEPGEAFTYDFIVPDAGLFWYHPHVMSASQVGFGLYGALLVDEPGDPVAVADQLVLVLSDIAVDEKTGALEPADTGGQAGDMLGREGNHVLVNGRVRPAIVAREGALQRWRVVNAAKSRYFALVLGDRQPFVWIGVDGGRIERSFESDRVVLGPGERVDVIVAPRAERKAPVILRSIPFDRGFGSTEFRTVEDLLTIRFADMPPVARAKSPTFTREIAALTSSDARRVEIELSVTENGDRSGFGINGLSFPQAKPVVASLGETQLWTITNKAAWAHPIHLHGFFFQVVDAAGVPVKPLAWKDTVHVPVNGTVRFLVRLDRPGSWMYHCHILDHAEAGLMSTVDVGTLRPATHVHRVDSEKP